MFIFAFFGCVYGAAKRLYDTKDKSKRPNSQNHPALYVTIWVHILDISNIKSMFWIRNQSKTFVNLFVDRIIRETSENTENANLDFLILDHVKKSVSNVNCFSENSEFWNALPTYFLSYGRLSFTLTEFMKFDHF